MSFTGQLTDKPFGFWSCASADVNSFGAFRRGYSEDFVPPAVVNDGALLDGSGAVVAAGGAPQTIYFVVGLESGHVYSSHATREQASQARHSLSPSGMGFRIAVAVL